MKIVVGLGNPGKKYERTRHNAGFLAVDAFARAQHVDVAREKHRTLFGKGNIDSGQIVVAKPQTYMNESGRAVAAIVRELYGSTADLIVIHDELDLALGSVRVKIGGGHGGHNGLRSIIAETGSSDFIRVRVGIGRPDPGMDPADYVLRPFLAAERELAAESITRAAEAVSAIITQGAAKAMTIFNQK